MEPGGLVLLLIVCVAFAFVLAYAILKAAPPAAALPVTADWIEELSLDRYRPMLRLLDPDELCHLRSQPGCSKNHGVSSY